MHTICVLDKLLNFINIYIFLQRVIGLDELSPEKHYWLEYW